MRLTLVSVCLAIAVSCGKPKPPPYSETLELTFPVESQPSAAVSRLSRISTQTDWANLVQRAQGQLGERFRVTLTSAQISADGGCTDEAPIVADSVLLSIEDSVLFNRIVGLNLKTPFQFRFPEAFDVPIANTFVTGFDSVAPASHPRAFMIALELARTNENWRRYCIPEAVTLRMTFLAEQQEDSAL